MSKTNLPIEVIKVNSADIYNYVYNMQRYVLVQCKISQAIHRILMGHFLHMQFCNFFTEVQPLSCPIQYKSVMTT